MTQDTRWVSGGLVFLGTRQMDMAETAQRVGSVLDRWGARVLAIRIGSALTASLKTADYDVNLTLHHDDGAIAQRGAAGVYMNVEIAARRTEQNPGGAAIDGLLVHVRRELHKAYTQTRTANEMPPEPPAPPPSAQVPVLAGGPMLSRLLCLRKKLPSRTEAAELSPEAVALNRARLMYQAQHEQSWTAAPKDQCTLRNALRETTPQAEETPTMTDLLRLSAWLLSIAVGLLCLPLGLALMLINMLRGENLRLASQTAALTGTFVALQATGATAQAAQLFQTLLS